MQNQLSARLWLLVEDDESQYLLLRRASRSIPLCPVLLWFRDGVDAQTYLSGKFQDEIGAIISDITMPRMSGLELLEWLKRQGALARIPFFVLSSSDGDV